MKAEKLVIGWTKKIFEEKEFKDLALPPLYLLQMISQWIMREECLLNGKDADGALRSTRIGIKQIILAAKGTRDTDNQ